MRLLSSLVILIALTGQLAAQTARHGIYLGGDLPVLQYSRMEYPYFGAYSPFPREGGLFDRWKSGLQPVGFFISPRLLIGARFDYRHITHTFPRRETWRSDETYSAIRPFLRYYLGDGSRIWDVYGELGFGRIGLKGYTGVETDFHLAAGTEVRLGGGLLASARLAYNAYASDLNYTTLDIGQRILIHELGGLNMEPRLRKGAVFLSGKVLGANVGHMRRQDKDWLEYDLEIMPTAGYFLRDGLAVMAEINWLVEGVYDHVKPEWRSRYAGNGVETEFLGLLGFRYYPLRLSRIQAFAEANIGHYRYESDPEHPLAEVATVRGTAYRGGLGLAYFLSSRVSLELSGRYLKQEEEIMQWLWTRTVPAGTKGFSANVGFAFQLVD